MYEKLFKSSRTIQRHRSAPLREERLQYLAARAAEGAAQTSLKTIAAYQLVIIDALKLDGRLVITPTEIALMAGRWVSRRPPRPSKRDGAAVKRLFISLATNWLLFMGRLQTPVVERHVDFDRVAEFASHMREERNLSALTIRTRCGHVEEFLRRAHAQGKNLHGVSVTDIDEAIIRKHEVDGCTRASIQTYAYTLRAFFRYAQMRQWCRPGIAAAILPPRVYKGEMLPLGPSWEQLQRLIAGTDGEHPTDIRDRAILMLLAVYGVRVGEVRRLRLNDIDWDRDVIHITRSKPHQRTQTYPLSATVGDAILRYLTDIRRRCHYREVFLQIKAPFRPLSPAAYWQIVSRRLRALGVALPHYGPHGLRHACATRLLAQGLSMKEIADYLGHSNTASTAVYAKVDLAGLRKVSDFNLRGLL